MMKLQAAFSLLYILSLSGHGDAFHPAGITRQVPATSLAATKTPVNDIVKAGQSFTAAATIFACALVTDLAIAAPANAELELSRGTFVVQSSNQPSRSLVKTEIDSQSLLKTIFKNRKDLAASIGRIQFTIQDELNQSVWKDVQKEVLDIEGDVLPTFKLTPPSDIRETVKDISKGKLNFLINGEIVNVSVEPSFGEQEDDLIIRVTGFKGGKLPGIATEAQRSAQPVYGPIRAWFSQFKSFWEFWDEQFASKYLPDGVKATNGQIVLTGTAGAISFAYLFSYTYYIQLLEQEEAAAAAKKAAIAAKKAKKDVPKATKPEKEPEEIVIMDTKTEKEPDEIGVKTDETPAENETTGSTASSSTKGKKRRRFRFWRKD